MRLIVLGSNGTYPTPGRPGSGYLAEVGESRILLDCGPGVFPAMLARETVPDVIVLSHRHPDHCVDILSLFNYLRFDRPEVRGVALLAPTGVIDHLAAFGGFRSTHPFFEVFDVAAVAPGTSLRFDSTSLEFGDAVHPVPAVCVRVDHGGASLTYSGDTGPGGGLVELAHRSDLLLCEATHQGVPPPDRYQFHLFASEAGQAAADADVGRLIVTHVGPTLDPAVSVAEAGRLFGGRVEHAAPGMEVEL